MGEQNPSVMLPPSAALKKNGNPRGRPCKIKSTSYGPKPRSIVSQILEEMVIANRITIPIQRSPKRDTSQLTTVHEQLDHSTDTTSLLFEETDQSQEYISSKPKKMYAKRKIREPKLYTCKFSNCIYSTKLSSNLQKHKRTHTGEKPYLCDRCSFRTSFSNSLKVHKRLHTRERPYQCNHCDYKCNSISNLKKHCHTKHKDITNSSEGSKLQVRNKTNGNKTYLA